MEEETSTKLTKLLNRLIEKELTQELTPGEVLLSDQLMRQNILIEKCLDELEAIKKMLKED